MNFTGAFGTLIFANPWILAGLIFLPALWFLLRVTPPAPRHMIFPAARFVSGLRPETPVASHTPWPVLLLRLAILALVILALARPTLNPGDALPGNAPIRLIIDNSWPSAQSWDRQMDEARRLINLAGREKREIYILGTAPEPESHEPVQHGPLTQTQAESILRGLAPLPWPADYKAALKQAQISVKDKKNFQTYWLSHGLKEGDASLFGFLLKQGDVTYIKPDAHALPVLIEPNTKITQKLSVLLNAPSDVPARTPVTINALGAGGHILDSKQLILTPDKISTEAVFDIPESLRNQVQQIRLSGYKGAGAILLLDDSAKRRDIGIASSSSGSDNAPLLEDPFYLQRALEPYANIFSGSVQEITAKNPAVIILPNIGALPADDLNTLEQWIRKGGLLLRFSGPNMIQGDDFLTPVPILKGGRALDGAMTWEKPVKIAPFPERSPFYGLPAPKDVTIRRQLLAQPIQGLENKTWAILEDGTPLVTADQMGNGLIVLVHTTATPLWSDLSLSGFFIDMLRRVISLAGNKNESPSQNAENGSLQPLLLLDGNGALMPPKGSVKPVSAEDFDKIIPNSMTPPGLYGRAGYQKSLNLGGTLPPLETFTSFPAGIKTAVYERNNEKDLLPLLLAISFFLFLADWIFMAALQTGKGRFQRVALHGFFLLILINPASAQTPEQSIKYAGNIHLAYIKTGNPSVDSTSQKGLEALSMILEQRTSVEPAGVIGITPEQELSFFPLIYWPITPDQSSLPNKTLQNIQHYIDHGGTIFFDTRDYDSATNSSYSQKGVHAEKLRIMIGSLNIPPLIQIDKDHVLGKSFYLLNDLADPYENGTLWIEEQSAIGRDGVSSIIIGNRDWAAFWVDRNGRQNEMTLRFGVNLVMYALTGNYKTDQVHLPHILERLGQ